MDRLSLWTLLIGKQNAYLPCPPGQFHNLIELININWKIFRQSLADVSICDKTQTNFVTLRKFLTSDFSLNKMRYLSKELTGLVL